MVTIKKLIPLHDKVLIKRDKAPTRTESGIELPGTADEGDRKSGIVVASGRGYFDGGKLIENDVKEGQHVVYDTYSSDEPIEINGEVHDLVGCNAVDGIIAE